MAESNSKSGILALAQKRLARTKTKVLQNLGKAEKTTDDLFTDCVQKIERQQEVAHHLQKELKTYLHCLRDLKAASTSLHSALSDTYEPEWTSESTFREQIQTFDLLWNDYLQNLQDSVMVQMNNYLQSFPVLKVKVAKRGRKMVDYDNSRHNLEVLQAAKKKDEVKVAKAQEELKEAKRIYEELNNDLHNELPEFYSSRVTFYANLFTNMFGAENTFHSEVGKTNGKLGDISEQLAKDFSQFVYQPRRPLSASISTKSIPHLFRSSGSAECTVNGETSGASSPPTPVASSSLSSPVREPVYNNQDVPETKQNNGDATKEELNGPAGTAAADEKVSVQKNLSDAPEYTPPHPPDESKTEDKHDDKTKDDDDDDEDDKKAQGDTDNKMGESFYEEPKEAAPAKKPETTTNNHVDNDASSDDELSDDDVDGTYSSPPSNKLCTAPPPGTLYTVQATHKYTPEDVDELSFEPGELIYVIPFESPDEQDDGWQMGIKESDGIKGVFPENFTQKM